MRRVEVPSLRIEPDEAVYHRLKRSQPEIEAPLAVRVKSVCRWHEKRSGIRKIREGLMGMV